MECDDDVGVDGGVWWSVMMLGVMMMWGSLGPT